MFKRKFEPFLSADDGLTVANGGNSPNPDEPIDDEPIDKPSDEPIDDDSDLDTDDLDVNEPTDEPTNEPPQEEITQTQAFSKRLSEARAKDLEEIAKLKRIADEKDNGLSVLMGAVKSYGYEGSPQEIADMITAAQQEITPEEARANRESQEAMLNKLVENHPAILAAKKAQEEQQQALLENKLKEDFRVISGLNPEIKSMQDLANHPQAHLINALVQSEGLTYGEAYKQIHELTHGTKPKVVDTKSHLKGVDGGTTGGTELADIPANELSTWKNAFPDLSLKELKTKYNNALNR